MRRLLIAVAICYFVAWIVICVADVVRVRAGDSGPLARGTWLSTAIAVGFGVVVLACWLGAIYTWNQKGGTGVGRVFSVLGLIVFGTLVGPIYILFNSRYVERRAADLAGGRAA